MFRDEKQKTKWERRKRKGNWVPGRCGGKNPTGPTSAERITRAKVQRDTIRPQGGGTGGLGRPVPRKRRPEEARRSCSRFWSRDEARNLKELAHLRKWTGRASPNQESSTKLFIYVHGCENIPLTEKGPCVSCRTSGARVPQSTLQEQERVCGDQLHCRISSSTNANWCFTLRSKGEGQRAGKDTVTPSDTWWTLPVNVTFLCLKE